MNIPKGKIKEDLVYKKTGEKDLFLTFLPPLVKKYEKSPVYFIIPGGGWHMETRQSMIDFSAQSVEALRNEGFAVVSIDYRVCGDGVVMNDIITDCFDAARYVAHYADIFEIDARKFVLSGHSAGGHLALMLAYAPSDCFKGDYEFDDKFSVLSAPVMSPPTVLNDNSTNNLRDIGDVFKGCDSKEERERTSPITYVCENTPPTLLCVGTSDYLVFANSSEKLRSKLTECGVCCELYYSIGGGHCFEKMHEGIEPDKGMPEMQSLITEFVLKHM